MAQPRKCECGTCRRCKHREYMLTWYRRNRDVACETARRTRQNNLEATRARDRERGFRPGPTEKIRARKAVNRALAKGELERKPCETCGRLDVHAHHDDYDKPLDVRWLCVVCHGIVHRKPIERADVT